VNFFAERGNLPAASRDDMVSKSFVQAPRKGDNQEASDGEQDLTQRIDHHRKRIKPEQDANM
jgi:hypothetical protein